MFRMGHFAIVLFLAVSSWAWSQEPLHPDTRLVLATSRLIHQEGLNEARLRHPRNRPWLSFTMGGILTLEDLLQDPAEGETLRAILLKANRNAVREAVERLGELSEPSLSEVRSLAGTGESLSAIKKRIIEAYLNLGRWEWGDLEKSSPAKREEWVKETLKNLEPTIKEDGRTLRRIALSPGAPFVYGWLGQHLVREYRGPKTPEFDRFLVYHPAGGSPPLSDPKPGDDARILLERYAPIIVQEIPSNPDYASDTDLIGALGWSEDGSGLQVDVKAPVVYAYSQTRRIAGEIYEQLVYTHWYPQHPKLKFLDAEAGKIEGLTLRMTLDHRNQPLVFETIYNCGCYHRLYVTRGLEAAARREFGAPLEGKSFSIERKVSGKIDLIVLEELPDRLDGQRPVLYCWGAYHLPGKVAIGMDSVNLDGEKLGTKEYLLQPYRTLELENGTSHTASVFDRTGLVRGADRMESLFLAPTGIFHAGTPRQRGTQLIHFDQEDFEDPELFEEHLRWPSSIP